MDDRTFERFRTLIHTKSGISLHAGKKPLLETRISARMRALGLERASDYLDLIVSDASGAEIVLLLDAVSTNVTSFFREPDHFSFLADVLARARSRGQQEFRIWSAASSSGEEPYTIAMVTQRAFSGEVRILATDISTRVLDVAMKGVYDAEKLQQIPADFQSECTQSVRGDANRFAIRDHVKRVVKFARLNLSERPFPMSKGFDVIFCRNVMIYFDDQMRRQLAREFARQLKPGGHLIIGHSEILPVEGTVFKSIRPSIYLKAA